MDLAHDDDDDDEHNDDIAGEIEKAFTGTTNTRLDKRTIVQYCARLTEM
jgi:hypothetical protein